MSNWTQWYPHASRRRQLMWANVFQQRHWKNLIISYCFGVNWKIRGTNCTLSLAAITSSTFLMFISAEQQRELINVGVMWDGLHEEAVKWRQENVFLSYLRSGSRHKGTLSEMPTCSSMAAILCGRLFDVQALALYCALSQELWPAGTERPVHASCVCNFQQRSKVLPPGNSCSKPPAEQKNHWCHPGSDSFTVFLLN